jgi:predicted RecB family nuclease
MVVELGTAGYRTQREVPLQFQLPAAGVVVVGRADLLVDLGDTVKVIDAKTGQRRAADAVQVMLYLEMLAAGGGPAIGNKPVQGELVYRNDRLAVPAVMPGFVDTVEYYAKLLASEAPPPKAPGSDCRFCKIGPLDCGERFQGDRA